MNKRQIKKKYKRINGNNPPKHFTVAQMRKCSTNSKFNNRLRFFCYSAEYGMKRAGNAISGLTKHFNNLTAAKMLGVCLEEEAKRVKLEELEKQAQMYNYNDPVMQAADNLLRALGTELGESRAEYVNKLLNE